jgi:uncharacterized protein (DUF2267 family)
MSMNELQKLLMEKVGLSPQIAEQVVQVVLTYLKGKLPPALATQFEALMSGKDIKDLDLGSVLGGLGGMFGGKK